MHSLQIFASDVNFWNNYDYDFMKLKHDSKMYPPYTSLLMCSKKNQRATVNLKIEGIKDPLRHVFKISKQFTTVSSSSAPRISTRSSVRLDEERDFNTLYTTLCQPLASQWEHIGSHLGVSPSTIQRISRDSHGALPCFREMLLAWLRQINPPPTTLKIIQVLLDLGFHEKAHQLEAMLSEHTE